MFHEYVKLLINNSRRISNENLTFTGNVSKLSDGFPKEYKGLEVKTGFGKGNWANVTWIGFLSGDQTIQKGIYPVYLYYRDKDVLILAYGVSETYKPSIEWPASNAQTVKDYFAKNGSPQKKYSQSLVYKAYTAEEIKNITDEFDKDLDYLIDMYKSFMSNNIAETSIEDNPDQIEVEDSSIPLQTIYFGSPGTGKSFGIKKHLLEQGIDEELKKNCDRLFRTTFHPDTDYSSFVGCYKPTKAQKGIKYDLEYLKKEFAKEPLEKQNKVKACIRFISKYAEAIYALREGDKVNSVIKEILGDNANGMETYFSEFTAEIVKERLKGADITYSFTAQAFTNAYVKAWETYQENPANPLPVYLVIEEINRGNCAQIFGDLFQLLDRKGDGSSEYPVKADTDLRNYLIELDKWGPNHPGIEGGNICLPPNLYILATMNTSDQSLFPMDSAFKRRWEWQYIPTSVIGDKKKILKVDNKEEKIILNKDQEQKVLKLGMYQYDWSLFLEKINKCITDATHSDDKQLGFWFVKTPKDSNEIKIETFVSKVIFYLWTDVFKDFGKKATNPFAYKDEKGEWHICPFSSFFDPYTGDINLGQIHGFMYNLGIIPELEPEIQAAIEKNIVEEGKPEA